MTNFITEMTFDQEAIALSCFQLKQYKHSKRNVLVVYKFCSQEKADENQVWASFKDKTDQK